MPRVAARRILLLALGVGVVVDITVPGHAAGLNAVVVMVALLGAACVAAGRDGLRRLDPADAWLPAARRSWLAAMAVLRADSWLVRRTSCFAAALAGAHDRRARRGADHAGPRAARCSTPPGRSSRPTLTGAIGVVRPQQAVAGAEPARTARRADARSATASGRGSPGRPGPAARHADPARVRAPVRLRRRRVRGLARSALRCRSPSTSRTSTGRAVVVLVVAWAAAGLLALAAGRLPLLIPGTGGGRRLPPGSIARRGERRRPGAQRADRWARSRPRPSSSPSTRCSPRSSSSSSPTCSAGATRSRSPGLTYADYARRGFFELVAVAVLAGTLVVCLDLAVRRRVASAARRRRSRCSR